MEKGKRPVKAEEIWKLSESGEFDLDNFPHFAIIPTVLGSPIALARREGYVLEI